MPSTSRPAREGRREQGSPDYHEQDVGTTASHVGCDGNGALAARLGHDLCLALVILGVEDVMLDSALLENAGEALGVSMETVPTRQG